MIVASQSDPAFPYSHAGDILELDWRDVTIESDESPEWQRAGKASSQYLDMKDAQPGDLIKLEFRIRAKLKALREAKLVPEAEEMREVTSAVVVIGPANGTAARTRNSIKLKPVDVDGPEVVYIGKWQNGEQPFTRSELSGDLKFEPSLVRRTMGTDADYAMFPGEELASSPETLVLLVASDVPDSKSSIRVDWKDFRALGNLVRGDEAWVVRLDATGDPELLMNQAILGFQNLMESGSPQGRRKATRDTFDSMIQGDIYSTLGAGLLFKLAIGSGDIEGVDLEGEGWEAGLLRDIAHVVSPSAKVETTLSRLVKAFKESPDRAPEELVNAMTAHFGAGPRIETLIAAVSKDS